MAPVPEIKLVRTDTTLDLSQKAEKVCFTAVDSRRLQPEDKNILLVGHLQGGEGRGETVSKVTASVTVSNALINRPQDMPPS